MKCIEIESENLIIKENEKGGITALAKSRKADIVILWNILTDIIVKAEGGKEMLESFFIMESSERKRVTMNMITAYRLSHNMMEFRELLNKVMEMKKS